MWKIRLIFSRHLVINENFLSFSAPRRTEQETTVTHSLTRRAFGASAFALALTPIGRAIAAPPSEIRIDWATYNPVSLVLKDQGLLEK